MSDLRRARIRSRFATDHERARRLAAERLSEEIGNTDALWLGEHLATCEACADVAAEYERDALGLRAAAARLPAPPRDLWARTSAALDEEERRHGRPRSRPIRPGRRTLVPYGVLAGALVVGVVVGSTLLSSGPVPAPPASTPMPSTAAMPTPLPIVAENVAWFTPQEDGTYALNVAAIQDVCPAGAEGCAPLDGSAREVLRLSAAPRAVLRSPSGSQIAVVDAATASVGGAIYMVRLPAPQATGTPASPSPSVIPIASAPPSPSESPTASALGPVTASPAETGGPSPMPTSMPPPTPRPAATASAPAPGASASTAGLETPLPSAAASDGTTVAIATGIVVVGQTMAYSPDGSWFAFTARPADGSAGPDIWLWHVGDALARPATTDHRSVFSAWLGGLLLGSRAEPEASAGTSPVTPSPDQSAAPTGDGSVVPSSAPVEATPPPTAISTTPSASVPEAGASSSPGSAGGEPAPASSPTPTGPLGIPASFLFDPVSGGRLDLAVPAWRPVVDPTGRWVVYWSGRLTLDPATRTWVPFDGSFTIAPWPTVAGVASSDGTFILPSLPPLPGASDGTAASDGTSAPSPESSLTPLTPVEPSGSILFPSATVPPGPTAVPGASTTVPGATSASGGAFASVTPDESGDTGGGSPSPTPFTPLLAPEPLPGIVAGIGLAPVPTDWEVRWDPSADHLALWIGDPVDPGFGRLSLLTIDPPTGQVDLANSLLRDEPALGGISLDEGRLAWATPPGQDGQGSRLQILGWGTAGSGQIGGDPVSGEGTVVVVR